MGVLMHDYSIDFSERKTVPFFIAGISIAFAYLIRLTLDYFKIDIPWWVDAPSVMGIYLFLYGVFDGRLWKIRFLSKIKNLSGEWEGYLESSHSEFKKKTKCRVVINQKWSSLSVILETKDSRSRSFSGALLTANPIGQELTFEYINEPFANAKEQMNTHKGSCTLLLEAHDKLSGQYYTGRGRMNHGLINLRRKK